MIRYAVLLNFTEKGIAEVKDSISRADRFRAAAAKMGASIEQTFWTLGQYDGLMILSAPDEATAAALVLELGKSSSVRSTMLRAFDAEEFRSVVGKLG